MMGNKEALKALAIEVVQNLAGIMPAIFKDITAQRRDRLVAAIEDYFWATGEFMVAKHFQTEQSSLVQHKEIVKDACLSTIISLLGLIEEDAKDKFLQAISTVAGNVIGTVLRGL